MTAYGIRREESPILKKNDTVEENPSADDISEPSVSMKNADNNEEARTRTAEEN